MEDIVKEHVRKAAERIALTSSSLFSGYIIPREERFGLLDKVDSPLEAIFAVWWLAYSMQDHFLSSDLVIVPQKSVTCGGSNYRLDFAIEPTRADIAAHPSWTPFAVELDGHAFHERTPEQVRHRDKRDRALIADGWVVFHFSFTEFVSNPTSCMSELLTAVCATYARAVCDIEDGK